MEHFDVGVVGTGYVGLATGASLGYVGHRVTCLDNNQERVASLREGKVPFYEPGLQELIAKSAGRLRLASAERPTEVIRASDVLILAVGAPQGGDGSADLSNVADVARAIWRALGGSTPRELPLVVVNKSTVPVGGAYYVSTLVDEGIDEVGGKGAVYHFASAASPADFGRIPIEILKTGALGTHNCLGVARARGARFMLVSTSEVYGDPLVHPQHEEYRANPHTHGPPRDPSLPRDPP